MSNERTTIEIKQETWRQLNARKQKAGESFDDVIQRLLASTDDS